jgi:hypothetical protein
VDFPPDEGKSLINKIESTKGFLYGSSDASLKHSTAAHSWIISSGDKDDIGNPLMNISGTGPVDGHSPYLSSTRGECQGQTAITVIANMFLKFHRSSVTLKIVSDSQNDQADTHLDNINRLWSHRTPDIDLRLQMQHESKELSIARDWVKSHQDKAPWDDIEDLKNLNLPTDATYNIWCDRIAEQTRTGVFSDAAPPVLPAEKWALYSVYLVTHKVTNNFNESIYSTLS